jgi:hypothetical protein
LLQGQSEIEKKNTDDRIVEPRVEKHAEGDKERKIAVEGSRHGLEL